MPALPTFSMHRLQSKSTWKIRAASVVGGRCASFWRPNTTKGTLKCHSKSRGIVLLNWIGLLWSCLKGTTLSSVPPWNLPLPSRSNTHSVTLTPTGLQKGLRRWRTLTSAAVGGRNTCSYRRVRLKGLRVSCL
uniref:Uncharacterized protein n=1 Tax=Cacopsylla melanoneura TaxID=428564 RepID=A0A8D8QYP1_9HEMI